MPAAAPSWRWAGGRCIGSARIIRREADCPGIAAVEHAPHLVRLFRRLFPPRLRPAAPLTPAPPIDVTAIAPAIAALRRTAVRLHPTSADRPLPTGISKMGGVFLANDARTWPTCPEHGPHLAILQLLRADVPELPWAAGTTVFQLTWCWGWHGDDWLDPAVRWLRPEDARPAADANPAPHGGGEDGTWVEGNGVAACALHPERVQEFPNEHELPPALLERIAAHPDLVALGREIEPDAAEYEDEESYGPHALGRIMYSRLLAAAPGTKVGGYADWADETFHPACCGRPMEHLVSVGSEWDGQSMMRWLPAVAARPFPPRRYGRHGFSGLALVFRCAGCGAIRHRYRK